MNEARSAALLIAVVLGVCALFYLEFRIVYDCGFVGLLHGAEWWWLFGYCR